MKRKLSKATVIALTVAITLTSPANAAQVTSGLLVDINIDNPISYSGTGVTVNDLAGAANNSGTLVSAPIYNRAYESNIQFDGTAEYMQIQNASDLQFTLSNTFTYMLWAKLDTYTAMDSLFSKQYGSTGGYDGFQLTLDVNNTLLLGQNGTNINDAYASSANAFTLGQWTLFTAVVRFGGGSANPSKVYVNGTQIITGANSETAMGNYTPSITIAAGYNGTTKYAPIMMGAFAIYNRALSATEISTSYDYYSNYFYDVSSISLGSTPNLKKGTSATLTATVGARGKVRFFNNGKRIPGCLAVPVSTASVPLTATCSWKPPTSGQLNLSARLYPSDSGISESVSELAVQTVRRSTIR